MYKVILKHASKYLGGSLIASLTALIMTKYYTFVFSPEEYGILALYLIMFTYIKTFVSLNMDTGSVRFYFDYRTTKRDEYLSTIFWFITFIALIILILGLYFRNPISSWIAPNSKNIYLITLLTGIASVYVSFFTGVLYNEHKSTSVLKHTLFQTFINHLSSFIFISFFHLGILGRMSGQGLGYTLNVFTLVREFYRDNLFKLRLTFNKAMASETFMLALPTIIASFQTIIFVYLDRVFIKYYMGDASVGIYTLGYMLGQGLSLIYEAVSQAILPKVFNDMNEHYEQAVIELESFSYKYYAGLVIITVIISLLSPLIVNVFSNENYSEASMVMPFIMAGFMIGGFYKIPSMILGYKKIVWFYPFLSFFAFGMNAIFNWLFIPLYGIVGAAFASFIGLFLYSYIVQILSFKFFTFKYKLAIHSIYLSVFLVVWYFFSLELL